MNTQYPKIREALIVHLKERLGATFDQYEAVKKIQQERHFELTPDILVPVSSLSILGLFYFIKEDTNQDELENKIDALIDAATYSRHLFIEQSEKSDQKPLPKTVELVFLCPRTMAGENRVGKILGETLRKTDSLQYIGINILYFDSKKEPFFVETELNRALSWMLTSTQAWFQWISQKEGKEVPPKERRQIEIELKNFRIQGTRNITLEKDRRVTIVFGRNGCGKSSFTEALELVMTGQIDRLEGNVLRNRPSTLENPACYTQTLIHRPSGKEKPIDSSTITLRYSKPSEKKVVEEVLMLSREDGVVDRPNTLPKIGELRAGSFRLNQEVMRILTELHESERYRFFLENFFPEEQEALESFYIAEQQLQEIEGEIEKTPWSRSSKASKDAVEELLSIKDLQTFFSAAEDQSTLQLHSIGSGLFGKLFDCLSKIPRQELPTLTPLLSEKERLEILPFANQKEVTLEELETLLVQLDKLVEKLLRQHQGGLESLDRASEILQKLQNWSPNEAENSADYETLLGEWLDSLALHNLVEMQRAVVNTFLDFRKYEDAFDPEIEKKYSVVKTSVIDARLPSAKEEELRIDRDVKYTRVEAAYSKDLKGERGAGAPNGEVIVPLTRAEIAFLDIAMEKIGRESLGNQINEAIYENRIVPVGEDLRIGETGWTAPLQKRIQEIRSALQLLIETASVASGQKKLRQLKELYRALQAKNVAEKGVQTSFLVKLSPQSEEGNLFNGAVNELINLFTPARWAYEPILLRQSTSPEGAKALEFKIGDGASESPQGAEAATHLNTAELNTFALSLFLLCAPKNQNPLDLLVLDDPLQNMDELTVTAVARGISRLSRIWKNLNLPTHLLFFFHGKENLNRFLAEVPATAIELPWLSPDGGQEQERIPEIRGFRTYNDEFQNLEDALSFAREGDKTALRLQVSLTGNP